MKTEIKKLWIDALESDEYSQTKNALKDDKGHCCLGVLCDLYHKETKRGGWDKDNLFITEEFIGDGDGNDIIKLEEEKLPSKVQEWAGIDDALGEFYRENGSNASLARLNDSGMDFKNIADTIKINF